MNSGKIDNSKHYPMNAFGNIVNNIEKIRVDCLESRLSPAIPFPHKHDFYQILLISSGKGWHEIDFVKHPVRRSSVFIMRPGQVHAWSLDKKTKGFVIEFELSSVQYAGHSSGFLTEILSHAPDSLEISADSQKSFQALCIAMKNEISEREMGYETLLCLYLAEFLILLHRQMPDRAAVKSRKDEYAAQFLRLVDTHFTKEHQVEFYARKLGVTTSTLTMRIRRALGCSPRAVIQKRCALEAKRMLGYSAAPISQIAYSLGFEDPNYFSRFFRSQTKMTPAAFRKKVHS